MKDNQPTLHNGIQKFFLDHLSDDFARVKVRRHETHERAHGRDMRRQYFVCDVPDALPNRKRWAKLKSIGLAINETRKIGRGRADGEPTYEIRCYILSRKLSGKQFAAAVRGHWSIENQLHWQLDVSFREDHCRVRKGHADANLSSLRRTALSLLKNNHAHKLGIKNKRLTAAWNPDYLAQVLFGP